MHSQPRGWSAWHSNRWADPAWQTALRTRINAIKQSRPLVEVAAAFTHLSPLHSGSRTVVGLCPLHDERTPSFHVYLEQDTFYCFGCQKWGDAITLVQSCLHLSFFAALDYLERGIVPTGNFPAPVPDAPLTPGALRGAAHEPDGRTRAMCARRSPSSRAALQLATDLYAQALWQTPRAQRYLVERGVSDAVALRHQLGYASGHGLIEQLGRYRIPLQVALDLGLIGGTPSRPYERFVDRLIVPEVRNAQPVWFTGRLVQCRGDAPPSADTPRRRKYLNLLGDRVLGGGPLVTGQLAVYLCEGPFDWLTLVGWGLAAGYFGGSPGGEGVPAELLSWLNHARIIYLVADSDPAGAHHCQALQVLLGARACPVQLPAGIKDPNDLHLLPDGRARFEHAVYSAASRFGAAGMSPLAAS